MSITITNQHIDDRIYDLLLENNITHLDVDLCAMRHMDKINDMMSIFDHKTPRDRQLVLGLLGLIAQEEHRDATINFYKETYGFTENPASDRDGIVLLLTACLYNPAFFSFAMSVCEDIEAELAAIPVTERRDIKTSSIKVIRSPHIINTNYKIPAEALAADSTEEKGFEDIYKYSINHENIRGTLFYMKDDLKNFQLRIHFTELQDPIPFVLEVHFTTINDGEKHTIPMLIDGGVKDTEERIIHIQSGVYDNINYTGGIEGTEVKVIYS